LPFQIDCTKHRCIDESEGRLWAESKGFLYFETSAQTGEGINEMFQVTRHFVVLGFMSRLAMPTFSLNYEKQNRNFSLEQTLFKEAGEKERERETLCVCVCV
jgi:hypothetical protein